MNTALLGVVAFLLFFIGVLHNIGEEFGKGFDGFLTHLSTRMGPGCVNQPSKVYIPAHWVFYTLAVATAVWAIIRIVC